MLCESKIINKNPKYRIIKYNDEYLMVDIISTWISLFFPFINWFIPKRYVKIWIYFIWRIDYVIPKCSIINELPKHNSIFCLDCSYNGFFSSEYSFNHR